MDTCQQMIQHEGCLVHLPDAKKGDIVVCISPEKWVGLSQETKILLSPFGAIDDIGSVERDVSSCGYRRATVFWQKEPPLLAQRNNNSSPSLSAVLKTENVPDETQTTTQVSNVTDRRNSNEMMMLFSIFVLALITMIASAITSLWDETKSRELSCMAGFMILLICLVPFVIFWTETERSNKRTRRRKGRRRSSQVGGAGLKKKRK